MSEEQILMSGRRESLCTELKPEYLRRDKAARDLSMKLSYLQCELPGNTEIDLQK